MDKPVLSDPMQYPTDAILSLHLRRAKSAFNALLQFNHSEHPDFIERWKYYHDGKSWLMNVSRKKKTLFWLSVGNGFFRTTFYVGSKAAKIVNASTLPNDLKKQFAASAGKTFRGITAVIQTKKDIEAYKELISIKLSLQ